MKGVMTHYQTSLQLIVSFEMYVNELHEFSHGILSYFDTKLPLKEGSLKIEVN